MHRNRTAPQSGLGSTARRPHFGSPVMSVACGLLLLGACLRSSTGENLNAVPARDARKVCGVNCLYLLAKYYHLNVTYEDLHAVLAPDDLGSSMLSLRVVAEQLGFETRAIEVDGRDILKFSSPMIVRAVYAGQESPQLGHWVVVLPVASRGGVWVFDPPKKPTWRPVADTEPTVGKRAQVLLLSPERNHSKSGREPGGTTSRSEDSPARAASSRVIFAWGALIGGLILLGCGVLLFRRR